MSNKKAYLKIKNRHKDMLSLNTMQYIVLIFCKYLVLFNRVYVN